MRLQLRAASRVAPDTAVPAVGLFEGGESLTPSPVIATRCPCFCRVLTMAYLCSGEDPGESVGFVDGGGDRCRNVVGVHGRRKTSVAVRIFCAHPQSAGGFDRDRGVVPGDHLHRDALTDDGRWLLCCHRVADRTSAGCPSTDQVVPPSMSGRPPTPGFPWPQKLADDLATGDFVSASGIGQRDDRLGAPLAATIVTPSDR